MTALSDARLDEELVAEVDRLREELLQEQLKAARLRDHLHDEEGLWHSAISDIEAGKEYV